MIWCSRSKSINKYQQPYQVLLIGGYPPPMGGVTVHIKRFHKFCRSSGFPIKVVSQFESAPLNDIIALKGGVISKVLHLLWLIATFRGKIVHIHASHFNHLVYGGIPILIATLFKRKILTIHSGVHAFPSKGNLRYHIVRCIMLNFDRIICVNEDQRQFIVDEYAVAEAKLSVIPSYISECDPIRQVSEEIKKFIISARKEVDYLIMSAGYMDTIYGYELLLDAVARIDHLKIGVILASYYKINKSYQELLFEKIKNHPHIWTFHDLDSDDFFYLIENSDLLIRPSYEDTYGMVVADAINLDTPAIASDVCERHPGTILFRKGDATDLREKIITTLKNLDEHAKRFGGNDFQVNYANEVIDLYKRMLDNEP